MADAWPLDVRVRVVRDDAAVVSISGEIDIATIPTLRTALATLCGDPLVRLVVCDMSQVTFLGCGGISVLLETRARLARRGGSLRLAGGGQAVLRPITVTGLLDVLPVSANVRSALI